VLLFNDWCGALDQRLVGLLGDELSALTEHHFRNEQTHHHSFSRPETHLTTAGTPPMPWPWGPNAELGKRESHCHHQLLVQIAHAFCGVQKKPACQ